MNQCKHCGIQFQEKYSKYSSGDFCSKICSRKYSQNFVSGTKKIICVQCEKEFDGDVRRSLNNQYCSSDCYNKKRNTECTVCGSKKPECPRPDICKKQIKQISKNLNKYFGFDISSIGSLKVIDEFDRIKNKLEYEYNILETSIPELAKMYGHSNVGNFDKLLKYLNIKKRSLSESQHISIKNGRPLPCSFQYKHGYHITWNGKQVYYRSSYELDYACLLDKDKINYDMENLRIEYWDSAINKKRIAIPDFYLPDSNTIVEIKSIYTYDERNMKDKMKTYKELGYGFKLILEKNNVDL